MSGTDTVAKLLPSRDVAAGTADATHLRDRLAWPTAIVVIAFVSGGLWYGVTIAVRSLLS